MRLIACTTTIVLLVVPGCSSDPGWQAAPAGAGPGADRPTAHIEGAEVTVVAISRMSRSGAGEEVSPSVPVFRPVYAEEVDRGPGGPARLHSEGEPA